MRNLNELYKLLKDFTSKNSYFFICNEIYDMRNTRVITNEEYYVLMAHFNANRPSKNKHSKFYDKSYYSASWWSGRNYEIRHRFIDKMIEITGTKKQNIIDLYEKETISYDLIAHKCQCEVSYVKSVIKKYEGK
jgi:hypothetical protein